MNKEIQSLVNQLNAASDAYYNGRDELMTDYEWDAAFDKLKKLEEGPHAGYRPCKNNPDLFIATKGNYERRIVELQKHVRR